MTESVLDSFRNEAANASALAVFGIELKKQRETADVSIEELFERTRINPAFLQAIEAGQFDQLPEAYTRLFLKNYALAVGLDAEDVLAYFDALKKVPVLEEAVPEEPPEPQTFFKDKKRIAGVFSVVILTVAAGIAVWFWLQPEPPFSQPGGEPAPAPLPSPPSGETALVNAYAMPVDIPLSEAGNGLQLRGRASEETWIWVWADGEPIFSFLLEAGEEKVWTAKRHFQVEVERPAAVALELEGRPLAVNVDPTHRARLYLSRFSIWVEERMLLDRSAKEL